VSGSVNGGRNGSQAEASARFSTVVETEQEPGSLLLMFGNGSDTTQTSKIPTACFRLAMGSRPCAGPYSCATYPVNPRSAIDCAIKR
jgi:hypothetical protein